jgi:hypothetical protein
MRLKKTDVYSSVFWESLHNFYHQRIVKKGKPHLNIKTHLKQTVFVTNLIFCQKPRFYQNFNDSGSVWLKQYDGREAKIFLTPALQ